MTNARNRDAGMTSGCLAARAAWSACRKTGVPEIAEPITLRKIASHYRQFHQLGAAAEIEYYAALPSVRDAIARAARAESPDGKRHPHQRRIRRCAMKEVQRRLARLQTGRLHSFNELYDRIHGMIADIAWVGDLMLYDTALRIGANIGLEPDYVYLHAGTRDGARALGLLSRAAFLTPEQLPAALRRLRPHEIEDCLCLYKHYLSPASDSSPVPST